MHGCAKNETRASLLSTRNLPTACCAALLVSFHLGAFAVSGKATAEPQLIDEALLRFSYQGGRMNCRYMRLDAQ